MPMRDWHRWTMTVFGVVLLYWATSGLVIATYDLTDPAQSWAIEGGGPGARLVEATSTLPALPSPTNLATGIETARSRVADMSVASVDLRRVSQGIRLQLADASGDRGHMHRFYADSGRPMSDLVADGDLNAPKNPTQGLRNAIKGWHRGSALGLVGQAVGLLAGLALIVLIMTGCLHYLRLWKGRRNMGRAGFFWAGKESVWRRTHRWVGAVAAAFLLNIAVTGVVLAWGELQLGVFLKYGVGAPPYPRPSPMPAVSARPLPRNWPDMLRTTYDAAQRQHEGSQITSVTLVERATGPTVGLATLGGDRPAMLAMNAQTGAAISDWAASGVQRGNGYFSDWHQIFKRLHRGDIVGDFSGRYFDILTGLSLLYLVLTSFSLYWRMFSQRRAKNRHGLFWR